MADLVPAWAHDGERREPTADEIETGFGCGPLALPLWNWMFYALWSEIGHVLTYNGITPDNGDMEQLRKAIQAQIDASTGGGDPSSYLTLLQASARLPIFPEVQTASGHFGVVTPGTGQVRIPGGVTFLHRGISPYTTVQTDLATDASKTYHLRWNKTDGFTLKDLASGGYNPGTLAESDPSFDSTYDDMLVARVITNSSNVPTVTNLINKNVYQTTKAAASTVANPATLITATGTATLTYDLARTPQIAPYASTMSVSPTVSSSSFGPTDRHDHDHQLSYVATRYAATVTLARDYLIAAQISALVSMVGG